MYTLLLVLFLYMIRCPHSLQRIGSLGLISFLAPQSRGSGFGIQVTVMNLSPTCTQILHIEALLLLLS